MLTLFKNDKKNVVNITTYNLLVGDIYFKICKYQVDTRGNINRFCQEIIMDISVNKV